MKLKYIKAIIICVFISVLTGQCGLAYDQIAPSDANKVDINTFKKIKEVKTIFTKKKEQKVQEQEAKTQETEEQIIEEQERKGLRIKKSESNEPLSEFDDEETEVFSSKKEDLTKYQKPKTNKKRFNFFKKKNKPQKTKETTEETFQQEEIKDDFVIEDDRTYINDTDLVYIQEVEIYGNNLLDVNYIKQQLSSKEGEQYVRSQVSNDLRKLYSTGYFTQNIRALPIKIDDNNVKLRIILEENPPIAGFNVVGVKSIKKSEIMDILNEYKGLPQNILNINKAMEEIQELYSTKGYILARVSKVVDDPDGYVNLLIDEGVIGDIIVDGNNKTRDFIVKRNIFLQPGSVYNENTMRSDILRLMGTSAFKDVQRELKRDEQTGLYDVYIALEEQRTGKISLGVGIDSASGFFGSVGFGENNFRGLGQKLNLNLLAGTGILMNDSSVIKKANLQGELSFLEPMFKRENQSLMIRGFGRYYGSYQVPLAIEKRFGGEINIARQFISYKNLSGSIGFGVESVDLSEGDYKESKRRYRIANMDFSQREKELDGGFYVKVTPALVYDTRDSSINARRGTLARLTFEENLALSGKTFGKLHGMVRKFVPIGKKSSIVFTGKAGGKIHGSMPDFAGYSLGGPYTIRGFNIAEVGVGDGYMLASAEYRVPIPFIDRLTSNSFLNNLRLAAFVDAGTLFNRSIGSRVYDKPGYAISAGVGLRIFIPGLGPINLDYGIPLTNTKGVHRSSGFFTFGMGEMY